MNDETILKEVALGVTKFDDLYYHTNVFKDEKNNLIPISSAFDLLNELVCCGYISPVYNPEKGNPYTLMLSEGKVDYLIDNYYIDSYTLRCDKVLPGRVEHEIRVTEALRSTILSLRNNNEISHWLYTKRFLKHTIKFSRRPLPNYRVCIEINARKAIPFSIVIDPENITSQKVIDRYIKLEDVVLLIFNSKRRKSWLKKRCTKLILNVQTTEYFLLRMVIILIKRKGFFVIYGKVVI